MLSNLTQEPSCTNPIVLDPQLVDSSNNQALPPTISSFSVMSFDNSELSDDLVRHALGIGVRGAAHLC